MLEYVFTFFDGIVFELATETYVLCREVVGIRLGDAVAADDINTLAVRRRNDAPGETLFDNLDAAVLAVDADKVVILLELDHIVEFLSVGGQDVVTDPAGIAGKAYDTVETALEFEFDFFWFLVVGAVLLFFLLLLLVLGGLFVALEKIFYLLHILAAGKVEIGLVIEEHYVDISFGSPTSVAAVAGLVGGVGHGLPAHGPFEIAVRIAALGKVGHLAASHIDEADIFVVHALSALVGRKDITAVRAPFKLDVAVGIGVVHTFRQQYLLLAAVCRADYESGAVAKISQPFAVGRNARLEADLSFRSDTFFPGIGREGEGLVLLVLQFALVDGPFTIPLGRVVDASAAVSEGDSTLSLGGVGNAAGIPKFQRSDEDITPGDHGDFLPVGRCCESGDAAGSNAVGILTLELVLLHTYGKFYGLLPFFLGVEITVP